MNDLIYCLSLSMSVTPALILFRMAVAGMVHGRLKTEPHQPWIIFRDRPVKFAAIVIFYLIGGSMFAAMTARIASRLPG